MMTTITIIVWHALFKKLPVYFVFGIINWQVYWFTFWTTWNCFISRTGKLSQLLR